MEGIKKLIAFIVGLLLIFGVTTLLFGCAIIKSGEVGVKTRFGKIQNTTIDEGLHFHIPFIENIKSVDIKVQKYENETSLATSSKDLQVINNIIVAVNYQLDGNKVVNLYKNVGKEYGTIIINPAIQESVKSVISQYTAEEIVTKRSEIALDINNNLNEKLNTYGITVLSVALKDFDFSTEYNNAIEKKAVAEQEVQTAKQQLEKAKIDAETKKVQAQGEADANKVLEKSLTDEILMEKFIEKWNGELPKVSGNTNGFIDFDSLLK